MTDAINNPLFSFGLFSDLHFNNKQPIEESINRLDLILNSFNQLDLSFVVSLGDLIDEGEKCYDAVLSQLEQLRYPIYYTLGNHDFEVSDQFKSKVLSFLNLKTRYYSFSLDNWLFVFLDGNDISLSAYPKDHHLHIQSLQYYENIRETLPEFRLERYNGALGKVQLDWLETTLKTAYDSQKKVIIFCHFPLLPISKYALWNAEKVTSVISSFPNVVAFINGHNHKGSFYTTLNTHFLTIKSASNIDAISYGVVEIYSQHLSIRGFGYMQSQTIAFPMTSRA